MQERGMQDFNSLDWDDLKVFLHAARGGSLGSAAKRLRVDRRPHPV